MSLPIHNVLRDFKKRYQIFDNSMLIVGVSGGCDSMTLLHGLQKIHSHITVAHVNYKLRGLESDQDAVLVEQIAKQYQLPFKSLTYDLKADLDQNGGNLQDRAREIRYRFFENLMNSEDLGYLVLAHHKGDQIENFWMQMARGGGLRAMSGMKMKESRILRPRAVPAHHPHAPCLGQHHEGHRGHEHQEPRAPGVSHRHPEHDPTAYWLPAHAGSRHDRGLQDFC